MSTMISVIDLSAPHMQNRIFSIIQQKQDGKCRHCRRLITVTDTVVSNGSGRGYYHKSCAERLHILWLLQTSFPVLVLREDKAILNHRLSQHGFKRQFKLSFEIKIYIRRYYYWTILTNYFMASIHFWHIRTWRDLRNCVTNRLAGVYGTFLKYIHILFMPLPQISPTILTFVLPQYSQVDRILGFCVLNFR
jgi:hypothetical protein